jgi:hypothetical protein
LAYADDIDIVGWTVSSVKEAFLVLSGAGKAMGLKANADKKRNLY